MDTALDRRYARHLSLAQVGAEGQRRLGTAKVLVVGLGGLGSPVALYLAAAGVGRLAFADFDTVEVSNLQRQIAHVDARVGELKTHSARAACLAIDPSLDIECIDHGIDEEDLDALVPGADVVLDCCDNFPTRFALNAACARHRVPLVSGAAIHFDGQVTVIDTRDPASPCYRCLYPGVDPDTAGADDCVQAGILGPVVGLVGCLQALEAIKLVCGIGDSLAGRLLLFDGLASEWTELRLARRADCPVCAERERTGTGSERAQCSVPAPSAAPGAPLNSASTSTGS